MRTRLILCVHLVALAAVSFLVSAAAAAPGPRWPVPERTTHVTKPVPAWVIVPKTTTMLGGSTYPWVAPVWTRVGGVMLPTLPRVIRVVNTEPPPWIPIG